MPETTEFVGNTITIDNTFSGQYVNKCILVDTSNTWIDGRFWLDYLAKADFFLSPPGICMPMCHNIVEAMSVGTIPLTNYPEWFNPHLEHMENCVVFSNKQDLFSSINMILSMNDDQIRQLRQNTIKYHDQYLTTAYFIKKLESMHDRHIDILMTTERYVKNFSQKLNKKSYIIRGDANLRVGPLRAALGRLTNEWISAPTIPNLAAKLWEQHVKRGRTLGK